MTERLHFHFSLSCIGEGNGNPLQCSRLENPRDRGALLCCCFEGFLVDFWTFPGANIKWDSQGCPEKATAPHSSTLAWKIPWVEEPGRLQSMGSLRVGYD